MTRTIGVMVFFIVIGGLPADYSWSSPAVFAADRPDRTEAASPAQNQPTENSPSQNTDDVESKKQLQAAAATFGTDPTAIVGYYEFHYEHDDLIGGERTENLVAVASLALTPSWLLQVTMPYEWNFPGQPGGPNKNGAGDLVIRTGWRVHAGPSVALFVGTDVVFPTASSDQLGGGKYQLGPGGAIAIPILELRSMLYGTVQDFTSIGGDSGRPDIRYAQFKISLNTVWSRQWWTQLDAVLNIDWTRDGRNGMTVDAEAGYQFNSRWQAFLQPGAGLWGHDVQGGYDWQVVGGARWMFSSPLIE